MPDASPPKWHLAHTSWFFETFLLRPLQPGYQVYRDSFEYLFNSYYNGIGRPFDRSRRGMLSRPTVAEIYQYRQHVDEHMLRLLDCVDADIAERVVLGLNHEQQHQELLLTDIKYNFGHNPLLPAYQELPDELKVAEVKSGTPGSDFQTFPGGLVRIGAHRADFCFDNELPEHSYYLEPYALSNRLVNNAEYMEFINDGGYQQAQLWLSDGWAWLQANPELRAPLYWQQRDGQWFEFQLSGLQPLQETAPVCHVSFYEADAYARWSGWRLPSEQEWEAAVKTPGTGTTEGNFLESGALQPQPPNAASGVRQIFGDVWEWTGSAYSPYPGFTPAAGALGEYNGKFMSNQRVLRGGSCATSKEHIRASYRNFFYPPDRWQFSGIRLARDEDPASG